MSRPPQLAAWILVLLIMLPAATMLVAPAAASDAKLGKQEVLKSPVSPGLLDNQGCSLGADVVVLTNGVATTASLAGNAGDNCQFSFVPDPAFSIARFVLPPTTPVDYDLYVKKGAVPTTVSYDCRPFLGGSSQELCDISVTDTTTIYAMVNYFSGGAGSFTLTASSINPPPTCSLGNGLTSLVDGVSITANLNTDTGANCRFSFVPNPVFSIARFVMNLTGSDFDLYVKKGSEPTTTTYDCRPFSGGGFTNETCDIPITDLTTIFAMVRRFSGSGNFSLTATSLDPPPTCSLGNGVSALSEGVTLTPSLTADTGANCKFSFVPAAGFDSANITVTPPTGSNFYLYLKAGSLPTTSSYDCVAFGSSGLARSCALTFLDTPTVYALVLRNTGSGAFSVTAQSFNACSLGRGIHALTSGVAQGASLTNDAGATCWFSLDGNPDADISDFFLPATAPADFDMYVKKGAVPTTAIGGWDCRPYSGGSSDEVCQQVLDEADPTATFYAMVRRFSGSGSFSLKGSMTVLPELGGLPFAGMVKAGRQDLYKVIVPADSTGLAVVLAGPSRGCVIPVQVCAFASDPVGTVVGQPLPVSVCGTAPPEVCGTLVGTGAGAVFADADLYVIKATRKILPTTSAYDCRGFAFGTNEACLFSNDAAGLPSLPIPPLPESATPLHVKSFLGAGKYFVGVRGFAGESAYAIAGAAVPPKVPPPLPALPEVPPLPELPQP